MIPPFPIRRKVLGCTAAAALAVVAGCATPGTGISGLPEVEPPVPRVVEPVRGPLTLDQAIARALAHSERIASLEAVADAAAEACHVAGDWRDPELRLQYGEESTDTERRLVSPPMTGPMSTTSDEGDSYRVGIRVFPPNPWARSARISVAQARLYAARAELRHARWQVVTGVRRLFAQVLHAEKDEQLLGEMVGLHKEMRQLTKQLLKKGQATLAEDIAVSRKYLRSLSDRNRAAQQYLSARQSLASLVGSPVATLDIVHDDKDLARMEFLAGQTEGLELTALRHRADLSAGLWRAAAAKAACREARTARIPWLSHVEGSLGGGRETGERTGTVDSQGRPVPEQLMSDDSTSDEWRASAWVSASLSSHGLAGRRPRNAGRPAGWRNGTVRRQNESAPRSRAPSTR
jgi:outer membrane protein TolC